MATIQRTVTSLEMFDAIFVEYVRKKISRLSGLTRVSPDEEEDPASPGGDKKTLKSPHRRHNDSFTVADAGERIFQSGRSLCDYLLYNSYKFNYHSIPVRPHTLTAVQHVIHSNESISFRAIYQREMSEIFCLDTISEYTPNRKDVTWIHVVVPDALDAICEYYHVHPLAVKVMKSTSIRQGLLFFGTEKSRTRLFSGGDGDEEFFASNPKGAALLLSLASVALENEDSIAYQQIHMFIDTRGASAGGRGGIAISFERRSVVATQLARRSRSQKKLSESERTFLQRSSSYESSAELMAKLQAGNAGLVDEALESAALDGVLPPSAPSAFIEGHTVLLTCSPLKTVPRARLGRGVTRSVEVDDYPQNEEAISGSVFTYIRHKLAQPRKYCNNELMEELNKSITLIDQVHQHGASFLLFETVFSLLEMTAPLITHYLTLQGRIYDDLLRAKASGADPTQSQGEEVLQKVESLRAGYRLMKRLLGNSRKVLKESNTLLSYVLPQEWVSHMLDNYNHAFYKVTKLDQQLDKITKEIHLAATRRSQQIQLVLSLVSTAFFPLNFMSGVFGMNFSRGGVLVQSLKLEHGAFIFHGISIIMVVVCFGIFIAKGWIEITDRGLPQPDQTSVVKKGRLLKKRTASVTPVTTSPMSPR